MSQKRRIIVRWPSVPIFSGTVPNFDGLYRENYEVFRYAALSRTPNRVSIWSRFECNLTLRIAADHFDGLIVPKLKMHQIHFQQGLPGLRWESLSCSPDPLVGWGKYTHTHFPRRLQCPYKCPEFLYHRFMVTLHYRWWRGVVVKCGSGPG